MAERRDEKGQGEDSGTGSEGDDGERINDPLTQSDQEAPRPSWESQPGSQD